jgi:branched-chain amino acid aminotransferase
MFLMDFDEGAWQNARIVPYAPLQLDPAAAILHYGQAVFDGLKVFRGVDGKLRAFRPADHAKRMGESCRRMCIPPMDGATIINSFRELVAVDGDWVPFSRGTSLYLRPTIIASEAFLGVRSAKRYLYFLIASPVGAYYHEGLNPIRILATAEYVRAVEGGVGAAKTAANYAASLYAAEQAKNLGFAQVLWLDAKSSRYLDEVGTMNIMVRINEEIVTPPLSGAILPGITRATALTLLRDWGYAVSERAISIDEVIQAAGTGALQEMWGTGTAAVVSPIGEFAYQGQSVVVNDRKVGPVTQKLLDEITGIQYGERPDNFGWTEVI